MKKIVALLIAVMMVSTVAFGAGILNTTTYESRTITVKYDGFTGGEQATVMAYTIEAGAANTEWDGEETSIIGLDQEASDGEFVIPLAEDYTGQIGVYVGSESTGLLTYVITLESGLPTEITTENVTNINGKTYVLKSTETVRIVAGEKMKNVTIDATAGSLKYLNGNGVDIDVKGKVKFNVGTINPVGDKAPITLSIAKDDDDTETRTVGFIWNDSGVIGEAYNFTVKNGDSAQKDWSIDLDGLTGNFRFAVGVTNVPVNAKLTIELPN